MSPSPTTSTLFDFNSYIIADPPLNLPTGQSQDLTQPTKDAIAPLSPSQLQSANTTPPPTDSAPEETVQTPILDALQPEISPELALPSSYVTPGPTTAFWTCTPNSSRTFESVPLTAAAHLANLYNSYGLYTPTTGDLPLTGDASLDVSYSAPLPSAPIPMDPDFGQGNNPYFTTAQSGSQGLAFAPTDPGSSTDSFVQQSIHSSPEGLAGTDSSTTLASSPQSMYLPRPVGPVRNTSTPEVAQNRRRSATTNTYSTSTPGTPLSSYTGYASGYPYPTASHRSNLVLQPSAPVMASGYNMIPQPHPPPPPHVGFMTGKRVFHPNPANISPPVNVDFGQLSYGTGIALFNPAYGYGTYGNDGFGVDMELKPARFKPTKEQLEILINSYEENK